MNKSKNAKIINYGAAESSPGENSSKSKKEVSGNNSSPPVSYFKLFRYVSKSDIILLLAGSLAAAGCGFSQTLLIIYFGKVTKALAINANSLEDSPEFCKNYPKSVTIPNGTSANQIIEDNATEDDSFLEEISGLALVMCYIGIGTWLLNFIYISAFNIVAENQTFRIRKRYLESLLRQNIGWYDTTPDKNFVSRISEDLVKLEEAIGEKLGLCIYFIATCLISLGAAFYHGWKLTLVVLSIAPILTVSTKIVAGMQSKMAKMEQDSYAKAGNIAQEALTNIKTVMAFSGANQEVERYVEALADSKLAGRKKGAFSSFGAGLMWLIIYFTYALAFWYGTKLILEGRADICNGLEPEYSPENMLIVFYCVMLGSFNIGQTASYMEAFATGKAAGSGIFSVIDRIPQIDSYSPAGKRLSGRLEGFISFKNVHFSYPSRQNVPILKDFSLNVLPGQTVALVGHSGCGKSTCIQLLQRFYDPNEGDGGSVEIDGVNLKDFQIGWLRSQIGVVSQEPILFNTTISENIRYGREDVTEKEIEEACRQANCHSFICKLPQKYETLVGDRGTQLSGGQKQRIAIARSLVRNPAILLLDEATSALDTQSEAVVQEALDKARLGRTTIIVAHRLSTIRNADVIVAIYNGQVVEEGTHVELLLKGGLYHSLVVAQMEENEMEADEEEDSLETDKQSPRGLKNRRRSKQTSIGDVEALPEEEIPMIPQFEEEESLQKLGNKSPTLRLLSMNASEWPYILIGTLSAALQGSIMPLYAIIFGEMLQTFGEPDAIKAQQSANKYSLYFVGIGLLAGTSMFLQTFMFTLAGEGLTQRLRRLSFGAMLKQEMGWFDIPANNVGALCSRLSGDAASIQGATGSQVGMIVQAVVSIILCLGVALYFKAKLACVALAFVPVVLFGSYYQSVILFGANLGEKIAEDESSKIAVQAVANIRTVASLGREQMFVKMYQNLLQKTHDDTLKVNLVRGFIYGMSHSMPNFAYGAVYFFGGWLVANEGMEFGDIFKVGQAIIMGSLVVGRALSFQPNYSKAMISGERILRLLDRHPKIDNSPEFGKYIAKANVKGEIKLNQVAFHYPTRPSAKILRSLSLAVEAGKSVALVGPSGCGKSTTIQLILRYYDPTGGSVNLDNQDISEMNLESVRSQMAIVAQEPSLFDRTIAENIAYGDNSRKMTIEEIMEAAKLANIHNFICSLPSGYETKVGEMGTQLSGGQKQRVAIARALVRNPRILLLDEATSALDTESEKVVQEALDTASSGRTSITIAHRLSSIQHSDNIIVLNNGEVWEEGSHQQLLERKGGIYRKLWNIQAGKH